MLLMLLATPVRMVLVVVKRLRAGSCSTSSSSCPRAPPQCEAEPSAPCASLAILKVPRTGSTWLTKELRALGAAVALEFEPFTDGAARTCPGRFYTLGLGRALGHRLRCVTREARSLSCYWNKLGCNATRLKPRPDHRSRSNASISSSSSSSSSSALSMAAAVPAVRQGALLTGFLLNPMYAPGAIWNRVLASQPRARLVWLRRTNLVKMALSDIKRLATATARQHRGGGEAGGSGGGRRLGHDRASIGVIEPRTLLTRINMTLVTQATFPAAVALDRGMLVLYEDLQTQRLSVLRALFAFLGIDRIPRVAEALERQGRLERERRAADPDPRGTHAAPSRGWLSQSTHWQKASEDVCDGLPPGNCERLRAGLTGKPCLQAQLRSTTPAAWSFPNFNGTLSLLELDGHCAQLPPLPEAPAFESGVPTGPDTASTDHSDACPRARRTLFELYG